MRQLGITQSSAIAMKERHGD